MRKSLCIALMAISTTYASAQDGDYYKNPYDIQDSLFSQPATAPKIAKQFVKRPFKNSLEKQGGTRLKRGAEVEQRETAGASESR